MINILADENIAYAQEAFSAFGNVTLKAGRAIRQADLCKQDVLLVRSVTQVNQALLQDTAIKFVGTATIGMDHIDLDYLQSQSIPFVSCAGCNANAVAEYVITALLFQHALTDWQTKTVAIIGYGNVGQALAQWLQALGINYIVNDPPLAQSGAMPEQTFVDLETALTADAISLHVPLVTNGSWPTLYLLDEVQLEQIKDKAIVVNTCRGEVINNAVLADIAVRKKLYLALDVWEGEPEPLPELVQLAQIATPHIAGYSLEGKLNGTRMLYNALSDRFERQHTWQYSLPAYDIDFHIDKQDITSLIRRHYAIEHDIKQFKAILSQSDPATYFDGLRKYYALRRELSVERVIDLLR